MHLICFGPKFFLGNCPCVVWMLDFDERIFSPVVKSLLPLRNSSPPVDVVLVCAPLVLYQMNNEATSNCIRSFHSKMGSCPVKFDNQIWSTIMNFWHFDCQNWIAVRIHQHSLVRIHGENLLGNLVGRFEQSCSWILTAPCWLVLREILSCSRVLQGNGHRSLNCLFGHHWKIRTPWTTICVLPVQRSFGYPGSSGFASFSSSVNFILDPSCTDAVK